MKLSLNLYFFFFLRSLRLSCCRKWYLRYMASFHSSITWQTKRKVWFRFSPGGKQEVKNPKASFGHRYARTRSCRQRQTLSPIHFKMESREEDVNRKAHTCSCLKTLEVWTKTRGGRVTGWRDVGCGSRCIWHKSKTLCANWAQMQISMWLWKSRSVSLWFSSVLNLLQKNECY